MRHTLAMRLLPVAGALVLAFGLVSSVEAAAAPARASSQSHTLEASPNAGTAWSVLEQLAESGLLPPAAADAIREVLANFAPPADLDASERREARRGPGASPANVACRRVAASAEAAPELVERCREWLQSQSEDGPGVRTVCRRILAATAVDPSLVERCREVLGEHEDQHPFAACRRILAAQEPQESLVERCRDLLSDGERERPERERPERERPERERSGARIIQPAGRVTR